MRKQCNNNIWIRGAHQIILTIRLDFVFIFNTANKDTEISISNTYQNNWVVLNMIKLIPVIAENYGTSLVAWL